jgi:predicted phage terminase large subunit-like protein
MTKPIPTIDQLSSLDPKKLAAEFFPSYVASQFPGYLFAPHNLLIARYLMAVEKGEITRLIVNMPPRHGKTMMISEFFPAWCLGRHPEWQIISTTYAFDKAGDAGRKVRNQMIGPTHQNIFPNCSISKDSKGANKFNTAQGGTYVSVGVGGAITGRGAHLFLIDDPLKGREDAESPAMRKKLIDWYRSVAYTRLMPGNSAIILVQTRWHHEDLTGYLMTEQTDDGWVSLSLPAIATQDQDVIGRNSGDALWPEQFPKRKLDQIKASVGSREWNSQFQQSPTPSEGGMVQLNWFERYPGKDLTASRVLARMGMRPVPLNISNGNGELVKFKRLVISWDTAFKESEIHDPSACTVWGIAKNGYYLISCFTGRYDYPRLKKAAVRIWNQISSYDVPGNVPVLIEDRGSGQSLIQDLRRSTKMPVIPIQAEINKQFRLESVTDLIEGGKVFLPSNAVWLSDFELQLCQFPYGAHDDIVDSTSQFLRWAGKVKKFQRRKGPIFWK